jgi:hypothetical protein
MPSVLKHHHTVNSAANISAVKMEQERKFILTPSISSIVFEILISFPWQRNIHQQTKNSLLELAN